MQSPSSLGPKVQIQTHGSPKNASWDGEQSHGTFGVTLPVTSCIVIVIGNHQKQSLYLFDFQSKYIYIYSMEPYMHHAA